MTTLRIEHAIHDYEIWQKAFDSFAEARANAGVRSFTIRQPVDDPKYLMLDLEFDASGRAEAFAEFLHQQVWSTPASSPALAGAPRPGSSTLCEARNAALTRLLLPASPAFRRVNADSDRRPATSE
ncbi:MAG TPA: hypothetical protein VIV12_07645 [Streptosporangiaceae bacterium]